MAAHDYMSAYQSYSMAIRAQSTAGVHYSNRSAASCKLGDYLAALEDAELCIKLKPDWPKSYGRKGRALQGLGFLQLAVEAYMQMQECECSSDKPSAETTQTIAKLQEELATATESTRDQEINDLQQMMQVSVDFNSSFPHFR